MRAGIVGIISVVLFLILTSWCADRIEKRDEGRTDEETIYWNTFKTQVEEYVRASLTEQ